MAANYLIHAYEDPTGAPHITVSLDDKWFLIPPNEPFEVDLDSNGRQLDNPEFYAHVLVQQYGPLYGLTEVVKTKTRTGITLDIDHALEKARATLLLNRHRHINLWAQEQMQTRLNKNLPILPPTGFVEESIRVLNIDLQASYNFRPVGWNFKPATPTTITPDFDVSTAAARDEEVASLKGQVDQLTVMVQELLEASQHSKKGKG